MCDSDREAFQVKFTRRHTTNVDKKTASQPANKQSDQAKRSEKTIQ